MEIAWLEDFVALAEHMNFSRAAEQRNVTQPAFSRRIRALEAWVGHPLLDRDSHRLSLTTAGETFLITAEEVLSRLERGRQEARETARSSSAKLRFAATHVLSLTFFPAWLRTMESLIAFSTVELIADNMQACERIMLEGQAQFLLCHAHPAATNRLGPAAFESTHLGVDVLVPVTACDRDGRPRYSLPGSSEAPVPHLAFTDKSGMGRIIAAAWAHQRRPVWLKPVFASHLAIALKTAALEGRGIAWSPLSLISSELTPTGPLVRAGGEEWNVPM